MVEVSSGAFRGTPYHEAGDKTAVDGLSDLQALIRFWSVCTPVGETRVIHLSYQPPPLDATTVSVSHCS